MMTRSALGKEFYTTTCAGKTKEVRIIQRVPGKVLPRLVSVRGLNAVTLFSPRKWYYVQLYSTTVVVG